MLGNIFIAFSMAVPFIFGNYILTDQLNRTVLLLSSMAFLVGVGREIIKSIQDMKGDAKTGRRTMPIVMGKESSAIFASYYILMALLLSPLPYLFDPRFQDLFYLVPVFATDVLLIKTIIYALRLKKLEKARKISLMALGIGLAGFLLSALF
jgi:geranylgeranylglycerol-phosphate geranylgeranyltransferase